MLDKIFFGELRSFLHVIEFHKRGLPHIHLLIILKTHSKILTAEGIERYISAEIPDEKLNPTLHEIVMKHMIHGPCGDWCLVNGKCSKHYPKDYQEKTIIDEHEGVYYRRKNTSITYERPGNYLVNNCYVVPHCPTLLLLLNCHINVEVVSSVKAVRYLYKYIYKGHDASAIEISEINHDEIKDFIDSRYVGPVEAVWRIQGKLLQKESHSIHRLPAHLPNEQNVTISDEMNESEIQSVLNQTTMLLDYFALNARDRNAQKYYYTEIPLHFKFKKMKINGKIICQWQSRGNNFNIIGRMYSVSPSQIELFHLRLLLLSVKGAISFEDLKTKNWRCRNYLSNFKETCIALGLIEDDNEWKRAMEEGALWMMPRKL